MIEIRKLMREELYRLLNESPESETKFLRALQIDPYNFFEEKSLMINGLIINGRPIYIAAVMLSRENKYIFWTVVNSNVEDKITLCKSVKRDINRWISKFGTLYATMEKINLDNMKWVEWLGFEKIREDEDTITYKIGA